MMLSGSGKGLETIVMGDVGVESERGGRAEVGTVKDGLG